MVIFGSLAGLGLAFILSGLWFSRSRRVEDTRPWPLLWYPAFPTVLFFVGPACIVLSAMGLFPANSDSPWFVVVLYGGVGLGLVGCIFLFWEPNWARVYWRRRDYGPRLDDPSGDSIDPLP